MGLAGYSGQKIARIKAAAILSGLLGVDWQP